MATVNELVVHQSEYKVWRIRVADRVTGVPVNLDGNRLEVVLVDDSGTVLVAKTTGAGIVHEDQTSDQGAALLTFNAIDTATIEARRCKYIVWFVDAASLPQVAIEYSPATVRPAKRAP